MHARSGGNIEIMGLMQGKIQGDTMYIMDSFALPVEGTETRVNAQNEAYEYMVSYMEKSREVDIHNPLLLPCYASQTKCIHLVMIDWSYGECHWLVSLTSRLWLLAIWY
jgi:proteasome lid subunit RPN8/RPN11